MPFGKTAVLRLYRDLLRYAEQLKYTDKSYYRGYIRNQFEKNKELESGQAIEFAYKKGRVFLEKKKLV